MAEVTTVATRRVADLKNWTLNPRSISKDRYEELKNSIQELGFNDVLKLAKDGETVIGGNMRLRALKDLGIKEVNCIVTGAETEQDMFKIALRDNEAFGQYEREQLVELAYKLQIPELELDTYMIQLDAPQSLADLVNEDTTEEVVEDEAPEVDDSEPPVSKVGEIYQLGRHRVMCGDSTEQSSVFLLLENNEVDMLLTDPPYGIGISSNPVRQKHEKSNWDDEPITSQVVQQLLTYADKSVIWGGNYFDLPASKGFLVWDKKQPENFSLAMCEMAWSNVDKPAKIYRESVTSYQKDHPTQKPIGLLAWCMSIYDAGTNILDTYLGSGSTLIACEQTDRICYGMELDPKYVDVIRKRYAKFISPEDWEETWQELTAPVKQLQVA